MKIFKLYIIITLVALFSTIETYGQTEETIKTVVIDAGHGGKDVGAIGKDGYEKDLVLDVSLKLGKYIKKNIPNVKVIYTRETDVFVELHKRAEIANKNKADLFISIHANSNQSSKPYGAESYVMGLDKAAKNLDIVKTENSVILKEDNYQESYGNFNPNSPEAYIIFSLYQNVHHNQSLRMAELVQNQFKERVGRKDRGVKGAPFWVLWDSESPSILVELGFVSNPKESKFLFSEQGKDYMASAIYRAFKIFKTEIDGPIHFQESKKEPKNVKNLVNIEVNKSEENKKNVVFKVQFYSSPKQISLKSSKFKMFDKVEEYQSGKVYKYTYGSEKSLDAIKKKQTEARKKFPDAFVIAFFNGKKITIKEALKKIKE